MPKTGKEMTSGPIALKGELTEKYQNYTKGTPVVIREYENAHFTR